MALAIMSAAAVNFPGHAATNYPWLTFTLTDNTELSVPSENLQLTYAGGELKLTSASVDQTLPLQLLKSMRFESEQSGLEDRKAEANTPVTVFNSLGGNIGVFASIDEAVNSLPHGVYIISSGRSTKKVMF